MASTSMAQAAYLLPGVPVHQPSHLDGDPSLATEILPGPPSILSVQQPHKRDPKKPVYSYLHPTDPGSTYSGIVHGTIVAQEEALKGKRSAVSGRAQRASARNHNGAVSGEVPEPSLPVSEPYIMVVDDDTSPSRSNSLPAVDAGIAATDKTRLREKGKGREIEPAVRVKEEPRTMSLHATPDPQINNDDHCSSCRSHGALVYCDGCPRAFHLWCLNPPMDHIDEGDSRWFCPACVIRKHPPRKPPPGLFSPLISQLQASFPTEFQLPEDLRSFFKDVGTGPKGSYVDTSVVRQPRLNRFGLVDDRDSQRLRDKNGGPVLCFKCGTSSLPTALVPPPPTSSRPQRAAATVANNELWKSIVSCDYCDLHWHLDCLDPPLPTMPPINKKWMCPNHVQKILLPKLRIPKTAAPIDITKPRQSNNGNIEIIHAQPSTSRVKNVQVEEVYINGRKYRVPERIVILDFWNKVSSKAATKTDGNESPSEMSSPLTSLSSLDECDDNPPRTAEEEQLRVAQMLCNFQRGTRHHDSEPASHTDDTVASTSRSSRPDTLKPATSSSSSGATNGQSFTPASSVDAGSKTSTAKRKHDINGSQRHTSSSSLDDPFSSQPSVRIKLEEKEPNVFSHKAATSSRGRSIRRASHRGGNQHEPKRGKKRKEREDESSEDDIVELDEPKKSRTEKGSSGKKLSSPRKVPSTSTQTTPSLKIRLPPLSDVAARTLPAVSKPVAETNAHG